MITGREGASKYTLVEKAECGSNTHNATYLKNTHAQRSLKHAPTVVPAAAGTGVASSSSSESRPRRPLRLFSSRWAALLSAFSAALSALDAFLGITRAENTTLLLSVPDISRSKNKNY
jgi:hypothetical protein